MNRQDLPGRIAGVAVVMAAGLGLGLGAGRIWRPDAPRLDRPSSAPRPEVRLPDEGPGDRSRGAEPDPVPPRPAISRRALLIGVTKYHHLPDQRLDGPANDVRLLRRLLVERYQFPEDDIVTLTEDEGTPDRRPTRANIEREFHRLAERAQAGDQVVVLLSGHGSRQPESSPPDPVHPEPDGIDEVFLPADVSSWKGFPERVPNAIVDDEIGAWLDAIIAKRAYVWAIFDCCHSGTMTRGSEIVREVQPQGLLVPPEELENARRRAAARPARTRGGPPAKPIPFVPRQPSDYLVALFACRPNERAPESLQPPDSPNGRFHGLLTYSLVEILTRSATSKAPLTYRELARRLQVRYAARPRGSPTPLVEGRGQDRIVLGTEQPLRSPMLLTRDRDGYHVDAGDLHGLTPGSVLAVDSPAGAAEEPRLLGHVRVSATSPFDATVEPCAYEGSALVSDLAPLSTCRPVFIDYGLRRFRVAVQAPEDGEGRRRRLRDAVQPLAAAQGGLVELVEDPRQADWLLRSDRGRVELIEASGNRPPFPLPAPDDPAIGQALRQRLERVYRARNLVALASRFEGERSRGSSEVDVEVVVLRHKEPKDPGEPLPAPADGRVFRPGDLISFRVQNKSPTMRVDVTLLIVGSDFRIHSFYPQQGDPGQSLDPGEALTTLPPGGIDDKPPFGPECLVVIAAPASNLPVEFTALAQEGLPLTRGTIPGRALRSPLGELLEAAMFRSSSRRGLTPVVADRHAMRVLTWRTEPRQSTGR
jgi:hypothetical protein